METGSGSEGELTVTAASPAGGRHTATKRGSCWVADCFAWVQKTNQTKAGLLHDYSSSQFGRWCFSLSCFLYGVALLHKASYSINNLWYQHVIAKKANSAKKTAQKKTFCNRLILPGSIIPHILYDCVAATHTARSPSPDTGSTCSCWQICWGHDYNICLYRAHEVKGCPVQRSNISV